ncbi:hypothetical protein [Pseudonocardia alni]|uniref:hypothetical protein n=1 Tax=Pseudonocardia alni TaxID=33907 RepID=UPI0033F2894E
MSAEQPTVVHVVGEADAGITDSHGRELWQRVATVAAWRSALAAAIAAGDTDRSRVLAGRTTRDGVEVPTPLAAALRDLPGPVELLLSTTPDGTGPQSTERTGRELAAALAAVPDLFGPVVSRVDVVSAGFGDLAAADVVADALAGRPSAPVAVPMGSGATGLFLSVLSGVVASGRPWRIRALDDPGRAVELFPESREDPLAAWLLRLGYPAAVAELDGTGRVPHETVEYARQLAASFDRVARGRPHHFDLAEWVRADLRRGDGTAGLAVRAWIEKTYEHRRSRDPGASDLLAEARRAEGRYAGLGTLLTHVRHHAHEDPAPSAAWLRRPELSEIVRHSRESAHTRTPLPPETARTIEALLADLSAPTYLRPPAHLGVPTGTIASVWPISPLTNRHDPFAATVVASTPGTAVRIALGLDDGPVRVHCVPVGTEQLDDAADETEKILTDPLRWSGRLPGTTAAVRLTGLHDRNGVESVYAALSALDPPPDAIVVHPVGAKELFATCLAAASRLADRLAVPLLVQSVNRDDHEPTYHQIVPQLRSDALLLDLAARALERLECDTAARLLGLTGPRWRDAFAPRAAAIAELLRSEGDVDRLRAVDLCLVRLEADEADDVTLIRLLHTAAELLPRTGRRASRALQGLRDRLSINHGRQGIQAALRAEYHRSRPPTVTELLRQVVTEQATALGHGFLPGTTTLLEDLVADLRRVPAVGRIVRAADDPLDTGRAAP